MLREKCQRHILNWGLEANYSIRISLWESYLFQAVHISKAMARQGVYLAGSLKQIFNFVVSIKKGGFSFKNNFLLLFCNTYDWFYTICYSFAIYLDNLKDGEVVCRLFIYSKQKSKTKKLTLFKMSLL